MDVVVGARRATQEELHCQPALRIVVPIKSFPLAVIHWVDKVVDVNCTNLWQGVVDLSMQCEKDDPVPFVAMQV